MYIYIYILGMGSFPDSLGHHHHFSCVNMTNLDHRLKKKKKKDHNAAETRVGIKVHNLTPHNLTNQSGLKRFHKRQIKFKSHSFVHTEIYIYLNNKYHYYLFHYFTDQITVKMSV